MLKLEDLPQPTERENAESKLPPNLQLLWQASLDKYPRLSELSILEVFPNEEYFLRYTAGEFVAPTNEEDRPSIRVILGSPEHLNSLRDTRSTSVAIVAEKLGIKPEQMTGELLQAFIFLHEVGHSIDFFNNYQDDDSMQSLVEKAEAFELDYEAQKDSLPVPGLDPSDLRTTINEAGGFDAYLEKYPSACKDCVKLNITTEADLLRAQETAYRELPNENYADNFAAGILKDYIQNYVEKYKQEQVRLN